MTTQSWLLPEGVDELLAPESLQLERLRRDVLDLFSSWGYAFVIPPFMDFVDSLLTGTGSDLDLQTFKVVDQLSGKTMGLRADMTPQVARIDAHRSRGESPGRLCYVGTVVRTVPGGAGDTRIPMQVGAELYGHHGIESDCEIAGLMLATLKVASVQEMHLDLGHVGIYRGIVREFQIGPRAEHLLHDALQRKAGDEVKALARDFALAPGQGEVLAELATLNGGAEVLPEARRVLVDRVPGVAACLTELEALASAVGARHGDLPVHFDLAELRGYNYHTGVVFSALVPGVGREVARGGRYDEIGNVFGRARPATGFSTDLKQLLALGPPREDTAVGPVYAPLSKDEELLRRIADLRQQGEAVIMLLPGETPVANVRGMVRELKLISQQWQITESTGAETTAGGSS